MNALALPDLAVTTKFGNWTPTTIAAAISPDFTKYVQLEKDGTCVIRRVSDEVELARLPANPRFNNVEFLSNDRLLTTTKEVSVAIWNVSNSEVVKVADFPWRNLGLSVRPDGSQFLLGDEAGSMELFETTSGKSLLKLPPGQVNGDYAASIHPTKHFAAVSGYLFNICEIRNLQTGAITATVPLPAGRRGYFPEFSPDGLTLVIADGDGNGLMVFDFDPRTGATKLREYLPERIHGGLIPRWLPNGRQLILRGWGSGFYLTDLVSGRTLQSSERLPGSKSLFWHRIDPTGRRVGLTRVGESQNKLGIISIADGAECRFVPVTNNQVGARLVLLAGGRIAVSTTPGKILFHSTATGREISPPITLPSEPSQTAGNVITDHSGALATNGPLGMFRWPVAVNEQEPSKITIGPPQKMNLNIGQGGFGISRDGKVVAQAMFHGYLDAPFVGGWILNLNKLPYPQNIAPGSSGRQAHVTPDGRYAVFVFGDNQDGVVYDTTTFQLVKQFSTPTASTQITPDGKWLLTASDNGRVYKVGTWEPAHQLGGGTPVAVSPDSRFALFVYAPGQKRLVEIATGRELVRFEDPDLQQTAAAFSDDGATLVTNGLKGFRIWDLRLIRKGLAELGLDWDAPPYPPAIPDSGQIKLTIRGQEMLNPGYRHPYEEFQNKFEDLQKQATAIMKQPVTAKDFLNRGRYFASLGWLDLALKDWNTASKLDDGQFASREQVGNEMFRRGEWEKAIAEYDVVLKLAPKNAPSQFRRAAALTELKRFSAAMEDYTALVEADWLNTDSKYGLYVLRADVKERLGDNEGAEADRRLAATPIKNTDPKQSTLAPATAMNNTAWQLLVGQPARRVNRSAWILSREAVRMAPNSSTFYNTLGVAEYRCGLYLEAIGTLQKSLNLSKGQNGAFDLFPLAMCYAKLGDQSQAKKLHDAAMKWMAAQKNLSSSDKAELKLFQDELATLLKR